MTEVVEPEDYPPEVSTMVQKLNRDEDLLEEELRSIEVRLKKIRSLRGQLVTDYGPPPFSKCMNTSVEISRSGSRRPNIQRECPLSDDQIIETADEEAILTAFAQALPAPTIYPTESARWITAAGLVDRHFRSYRVSLRRIMENNPHIWRKEPDGGFTHIPTEERNLSEQKPKETVEVLGNESPDQNYLAQGVTSRVQEIDDAVR